MSRAPFRGRNSFLDENRALVTHYLPESWLDDTGADELCADAKRCAPCDLNDDLALTHVQQLNTARVVLKDGVENVIDDSLHRFAHPWSMRNSAPKRKHPQALSAEKKLSYTPRHTMQPARTRLQVDVRRQQLLELGLELFANRTYDDLSIDEIAKQAGISKGLLYHYFPSKRAFYVAAVREAARELLAETDIDQHGTGAEPDPEGVRAGVRAFLEYVSRRRVVYTFLLRGGIGTDPEVAKIIEDTRQALVDRMLSRLSRFGARSDDPATRLRLRGWIGFLEASSLDWAESQELDLESFVQLLVQMTSLVFAAVLHPPER